MFVLTALHIPIRSGPRIGWKTGSSHNPTSFDLLPPEYGRRPVRELIEFSGGAPQTRFGTPDESEQISETGEEKGDSEITGTADSLLGGQMALRPTRVEDLQILEFAEEQPDIVGGLNSLYLRIRYPKAAQESGIEGLVLVSFVVETDGSTSGIRVLKSLHPLCDEAAAEAIAETRFTPARQNGKKVRVRMHLPIRFVLIDDPMGLMVNRSDDGPDVDM
jgi:TonB family protein